MWQVWPHHCIVSKNEFMFTICFHNVYSNLGFSGSHWFGLFYYLSQSQNQEVYPMEYMPHTPFFLTHTMMCGLAQFIPSESTPIISRLGMWLLDIWFPIIISFNFFVYVDPCIHSCSQPSQNITPLFILAMCNIIFLSFKKKKLCTINNMIDKRTCYKPY